MHVNLALTDSYPAVRDSIYEFFVRRSAMLLNAQLRANLVQLQKARAAPVRHTAISLLRPYCSCLHLHASTRR